MGIEPTFPRLNPGFLSQLNYRNIRHRFAYRTRFGPRATWVVPSERSDGRVARSNGGTPAGNRTRTGQALATHGTPSLWWRIIDQLRPI